MSSRTLGTYITKKLSRTMKVENYQSKLNDIHLNCLFDAKAKCQ